ncbi:protein CEBPZOS [Onthophagus taurus]|uniref:protein CEBPZOS n=1 Tax=Onthophagus taurus TaxID=166361 RepID=UPI0039BE35EF
MLIKTPKPTKYKFVRKAATVLFVAEGLFFGGCYYVYHKLNTDRDFRFYMHNNFPKILNYYYSLGERIGGTGERIKEIDQAYWANNSN